MAGVAGGGYTTGTIESPPFSIDDDIYYGGYAISEGESDTVLSGPIVLKVKVLSDSKRDIILGIGSENYEYNHYGIDIEDHLFTAYFDYFGYLSESIKYSISLKAGEGTHYYTQAGVVVDEQSPCSITGINIGLSMAL